MALTTIPASLSATALTLTTAAQPNITSVGTLTGLTVSGNIAGTLTTAAQTNITSVGTLTGLTLSGNLTVNANTNITGNLTVDTNSFYVDATNNRVGIGTASPTHPLEVTVDSSGAQDLLILSNDNTATSNSAGLLFAPSNGIAGARIEALAMEDFSTSANRTADLLFYTRKDGTLTERMRIDSSGNVGIRSSSPSSYPVASELVVDTGVSGGITVVSDSTSGGYGGVFFADGTTGNEQYRGFIQYNHNNGGSVDELLLGTSGSEAMRIDSSGNVGIGETNPARRLSVRRDTGITSGFNDISQFLDTTLGVGGSVSLNLGRANSTKNLGKMAFKYAGSGSNSNALNFGFYDADNLMTLLTNGNVGIGTSSPSHKLEVSNAGAIIANVENSSSTADSRIRTTNTQAYVEMGQDSTGGYFQQSGSYPLRTFVNGSERMRIDSSGGIILPNYYWASNDVFKVYNITGPSTSSFTRTIDVNSYWGYLAQGGFFMYAIHGWQGDEAAGLIAWSNAGNNSQVIVNVFHREFFTPTFTSVTATKGSGDREIDITINGAHTNTHGWRWVVWA